MGDLAGLTAPRHICILQGLHDGVSLTEPAKEEFETTKRIYAAAGAPDNCTLYIAPEGHRYYYDAALAYIKAHLAE